MAITKEVTIKVNIQNEGNLKKVETGLKNVNKEAKETSKSVEKIGDPLSGLTSVLDKFTGGAITKFKAFTSGLGGIATGFKGIGVAIAASGIGLLITVIAAITAAFKSSEEGQNKFAKIMGVIGSVVGNVIDVLSDLGNFIIDLFSGDGEAMSKLKSFGKAIFDVVGLPIKTVIDTVKTLGKVLGALFSGDISGAFDRLNEGVQDIKGNFDEAAGAIGGAAKALKEFGEEALREAKIAADIADARANADKIERGLIVERAEANRKRAELLENAQDREKFNLQERLKFLKDASALEEDITNKEIAAATIRRDAILEENKLRKEEGKEALGAAAEATAAVINLETARLSKQKEVTGQINGLIEQEKAIGKAAFEARKAQTEKATDDQKKEDEALLALRADFEQKVLDLQAATELARLDRAEQLAVAELNRAEQLALAKLDRGEQLTQAELEVLENTEQQKDEIITFYAEQRLENELLRLDAEEDKALLELEALDASLQEKAEVEAFFRLQRADAEVQTEQDKQDRITAEERRQADLRLEYDEIIAANREANAKNLFSILGGIAKKGSDIAKGVAITQIVRDQVKSISQTISATAAGNQRAVLELGPIAGSAFAIKNTITAGIGIAASAVGAAKSIKDILSEKKTVAGGGGLNIGGGGSAPQAPSFNLVAGSGTNQIAEGLSREPVPLRAFVVSNEVTNAQSLDRNIQSNASFG